MPRRSVQGSAGEMLLVVIAIVFILLVAAIIVPKMCSSRCGNARITAAQMQIAEFKSNLDAIYNDCGRYPTTEEGLDALIKNPGITNWKGPYFSEDIPFDPWGTQAYRYDFRDGQPRIVSAGPDRKFDTPDDIASDQSK